MPITKFYTWLKSIAEEKAKALPTIEYEGKNRSPIFNIFWKDIDAKKALFYTRHSFVSELGDYYECFTFYFVIGKKVNVLCLDCGLAGVSQRLVPVVYESDSIIEVSYEMEGKKGEKIFNVYPKVYQTAF